MNTLAIVFRTLLHILILALVVKKAWPGELLSIPLPQLTLGGLLWGLAQIAVGFLLSSIIVLRIVSIPDKSKRDAEWRGGWIVAPFIIDLFVAFPFLYENSPRHNAVMNWLYTVTTNVIGWLIF